jgi:hypothetical protein
MRGLMREDSVKLIEERRSFARLINSGQKYM